MKPEDKKKFIAGKVAGKLTKKLFELRKSIIETVDESTKSIIETVDESMEQLLAVGFTEDEAKALLHTIVDRAFAEEI